jgi:hypothetical protein
LRKLTPACGDHIFDVIKMKLILVLLLCTLAYAETTKRERVAEMVHKWQRGKISLHFAFFKFSASLRAVLTLFSGKWISSELLQVRHNVHQ